MAGKQTGLADNFYLAGYDLSGDVNALSKISGGLTALDVTSINESAYERIGGLRTGGIDFTTFMHTTAGADDTGGLRNLPTADVVASYFRGTTVGNPSAACVAKQVGYDPTRGTDGSLTLAVTLQSNGYGLEWGEMLTAGIRTDTTATTGTFFDDGAGSSYGGQAYFQVFSVTGTSVTIDIQSCTTSGGTYATTGLTSSAVTHAAAPTAQRVAVSNTTTINRYLQVVTTGTFTNAQFAVTFVRNATAGQVF